MFCRTAAFAATFLSLSTLPAGCTGHADDNRITAEEAQPYDGIAAGENFYFGGTEPFWGGEIRGEMLTYSTPENIEGTQITAKRFSGMNGLGFSGKLGSQSFDMAVTEGECSDGMSDRTYPFTVTLKLGDEIRNGCGHSDSNPFSGPESP